MLVVGVTEQGEPAFEVVLDHGADPDVLAFDRGYIVVRPVEATRASSGELILRLLGASGRRRATSADAPTRTRRRTGARRRRTTSGQAAFCGVRGGHLEPWPARHEYSGRTAVTGRWGMPGGGLDDHEPPTSAVLREVAEETSQEIILGELIKVQTSHWVGRSPYGIIEDFHAVRLIYRASCPHPTEPVVLDQGGTTESAQWVPLESWRSVSWTQNWQLLLRPKLLNRVLRSAQASSTLQCDSRYGC